MQHPFGVRAQQDPAHSAAPVCRHRDDIDLMLLSRPVDLVGHLTVAHLSRDTIAPSAEVLGNPVEILARLVPHRVCAGNRPSNVLFLERLTPFALGTLVALYEHSVFTQGAIWNIDSFDQWGVELGKVLARRILPELESEKELAPENDSSTNALIRRYRGLKRRGPIPRAS